MKSEKARELYVRSIHEELSKVERGELNAYLAAHPEERTDFEEFGEINAALSLQTDTPSLEDEVSVADAVLATLAEEGHENSQESATKMLDIIFSPLVLAALAVAVASLSLLVGDIASIEYTVRDFTPSTFSDVPQTSGPRGVRFADIALVVFVTIFALITSVQSALSRRPVFTVAATGLLVGATTLLMLRGFFGVWSLREIFLQLMPRLAR